MFGLYFITKLSNVFGENVGNNMLLPPATKQAWTQHPSPKPWKIGIIDRIETWGPNFLQTSRSSNTKAFRFMLDKIIPFGVPVVPPL